LHEAEQRWRTIQTEHEEAVAQESRSTAYMSPRGAHAPTPRTGVMTDAMVDSSVTNAVASPHVESSHSPTSPVSWGATHSLPDLAVSKSSQASLELRSFYLQMLPLLRGVAIGVYRKASQRFEPHQLHISSDLQRLEIRPVPSSPASGVAVPRRRVAVAFVRVEVLVRLHVPRATLMAVQETIESHQTHDNNNDAFNSEHSAADGNGNGSRSGELQTISDARNASVRATTNRFLFDIILMGAEPWRLQVVDAQTFHTVTTAIGVLITLRSSLSSFAAALGLGVEV